MMDLLQTLGDALRLYLGLGLAAFSLLMLYGLVRSWNSTEPVNWTVILVAGVSVVLLWGAMLILALGWVLKQVAAGKPVTWKAMWGSRR